MQTPIGNEIMIDYEKRYALLIKALGVANKDDPFKAALEKIDEMSSKSSTSASEDICWSCTHLGMHYNGSIGCLAPKPRKEFPECFEEKDWERFQRIHNI